jgi:hypothetical protein
MATPTTSLPTRQQLDEIDALLKRMLSLPALPGEPADPAPAPEPPPAPAMTYPAPAIREVAPPAPPQAGDPVVREWRVEWSPPPAPQPPPVVAWGAPVAPAAMAALPPRFDPNPPYLPPTYPTATPATDQLPFAMPVGYVPGQPPPSSAKPPTSLPMQLVVLLNQVFNILTYLLGPLGTWLRGTGRNTLGWCGIMMLIAAGAWAAAEWQGFDWSRIELSRFGLPSIHR